MSSSVFGDDADHENETTSRLMARDEQRVQVCEDWVHDIENIHKEFVKAAWDVTGFQEEYRVWCDADVKRKMHMSSYDELFAMNEKYLRIIETNLGTVKYLLKADKANYLADVHEAYQQGQAVVVKMKPQVATGQRPIAANSVKEWMDKRLEIDANEGDDGSIFRRHAAYVDSKGTRQLLL